MKDIRQLFVQWFRAYPGLWLSPLGLLLLGSWMWLQPNQLTQPSSATETEVERLERSQKSGQAAGEAQVIAANPSPGQLDPDQLDQPGTNITASSNILTTNAEDFDAAADPNAYQERPAAKSSTPSNSDSSDNEAIANAPAPSTDSSNKTVADPISSGKTDVELAAGPDATNSDNIPSEADVAAAQAEAEAVARQQQIAAAQQAQQAAAQAAAQAEAPAPNVVTDGNPAVDQAIVMQVAIAEGDTNLSMGVSNGGVLFTTEGQALAEIQAGDHSMACDGQNLILNGQQSLPGTVLMAPVQGGLNYVRDRSYRGRIQFFCQGSTVLAVNHIDMLHYLYSVVGSEVSASWPIASLKAQTVAARSYALTYYFRPAKEHFHIGDSESYQVYKGTQTEDDRVKQAVHETAGEFISYDGGIVESLYAASDDIVMEAFQGGGMSQLGARDLSEQGYNYLQILGYYYPETSLGRLALDTN